MIGFGRSGLIRALMGFRDGLVRTVEKNQWTRKGGNGLEVMLVLELYFDPFVFFIVYLVAFIELGFFKWSD